MPKQFAYTDLSVKDSLYLDIDGTKFPVVQYNDSYAINEIPMCQCIIGVGRKVTKKGSSRVAVEPAEVHKNNSYRQMTKASVWFEPRGEFRPDGTKWPGGKRKIFDGYFTGFSYRKMNGKIQVVAPLIHWSVDLTASSILTAQGHVSNPSSLNEAAVLSSFNDSGASLGGYISQAAPAQLSQAAIATDVWQALKELFCALASIKTKPLAPSDQCLGNGDWTANDRALNAFKRIEGPAEKCEFTPTDGAKRYAVPLKLESTSEVVRKSLADAIAWRSTESFANSTFWDKLIGEYCPMFNMAFVPMVERALVIADLPMYRNGIWRTIEHGEYDSFDMTGMLERPLRAVGVLPTFTVQTDGAPYSVLGQRTGGCYVAKGVDPNEGIIRLVSAPPWLTQPQATLDDVLRTTGLEGDGTSRVAGADAPGKATTQANDTHGDNLSKVYSMYAQLVYANEMLRGRNGTFGGKLRFDIAPGSIIRIQQKAEKFLGAEDDLASPVVACVARVSNVLSAETPAAGTTFTLTHMRWENAESDDRTSLVSHPFFGKSIHGGGKHGSPLVVDWEFEAAKANAPAGGTIAGTQGDAGTLDGTAATA